MAIVYLLPTGVTDVDVNIGSGALTDVDEGVDAGTPDAALMISVTNGWTNQFTSRISFALDDMPANDAINSVTLRVRGEVVNPGTGDTYTYTWDTSNMTGSLTWTNADDNAGLANRTATITGFSEALINAALVEVGITARSQDKGNDGHDHRWDGFELEVDYDPPAAGNPPTTVIPRYYHQLMAEGI